MSPITAVAATRMGLLTFQRNSTSSPPRRLSKTVTFDRHGITRYWQPEPAPLGGLLRKSRRLLDEQPQPLAGTAILPLCAPHPMSAFARPRIRLDDGASFYPASAMPLGVLQSEGYHSAQV